MRGKIIIFLFLLGNCVVNAQAPNAMAFPSPNNNFINSIGITGVSTDIGVDLYTGMAQVNIPVCNLASKGLSIPVSLRYTGGSGIKVQDYATCAGLGWQLAAGGNISRIVRGFPDEAANGYLGGQWGSRLYQYADYTHLFPPSGSDPDYPKLIPPPVSGVVPTADGEPDLYNIQTPFFSFQFTVEVPDLNPNPDGTINIKMVNENDRDIQIKSNNIYSSHQFSSFIVTDASGNRYYFGGNNNAIESISSTLHTQSVEFPTTWYLTAIVPFNSTDSIQFNYISSSNTEEMWHYKQSRAYNALQGCSQLKNADEMSVVVAPKYLSSIVGSTGELDFSYLFDRVDVLGAGRLNTITSKSYSPTGASVNQTYQFKYTYFGSTASDASQVQYLASTDITVLRLKLDSILLSGSTPETAAPLRFKTFTYNTVENLPSHTANTFDYWGYYTLFQPLPNEPSDPLVNPGLRTPYESRTKANILTEVTEITGSKYKFDYEPNTYYNASTQGEYWAGGLRVKKVSQIIPSGATLQTLYQYVDGAGRSTGQIASESYKNLQLTDGSSVSETFSEVPFNIYDLNGVLVGYSSVKTISPDGGYTISDFTNFSDYPDNYIPVNNYNPVADPNVIAPVNFGYKRGILKSQAMYSAQGNKVSEDIFNYTSLTPSLKKSLAYKVNNFRIGPSSFSCSRAAYLDFNSLYYTNVFNHRLSSTVHREYDQKNTNQYAETVTNYTYCSNNRTIKTKSTIDSKGSTITQTTWHAHDAGIPTLDGNEGAIIAGLVNVNNLDAIIHQSSNKNGAISQEHNTYDKLGTTNKFFLTKKAHYRQNALVARRQLFQYDTQNSTLNGVFQQGSAPSTVLWGYNYSYPVANITGADYATVVAKVNPATIQNLTEENLRAALQPLRSIPGALVTTYTYKPLIGKTSETDVNNRTTTYDYDGLGRLQLIKDYEGNIVKKISYNYKGQPNSSSQYPTANWQEYDEPTCETDALGNNTGYVRLQVKDVNHSSSSYNSIHTLLEYNPNYCPLPSCSDPNICTAQGEGYACINGLCEYGYRIYTNVEWLNIGWGWFKRYTYHYEFSDGSWSENYYLMGSH